MKVYFCVVEGEEDASVTADQEEAGQAPADSTESEKTNQAQTEK